MTERADAKASLTTVGLPKPSPYDALRGKASVCPYR
jgi:hypothetical protein